jgi:hypothetical protein
MENSFIDICQYFKNTSTPEKVVALMGDKKLIASVLAWKSVVITKNDDEKCEFEGDNERWDWLWKRINWDRDKYHLVTGLKVQDVGTCFERLKGLKLIYPDGTIDKFATQYLNSIIMRALKTKS